VVRESGGRGSERRSKVREERRNQFQMAMARNMVEGEEQREDGFFLGSG
jgi:hypothetical protein